MVSTFTPNKRIEQPAHNDYVDSWDVPVNADWAIIDLALGSGVNINLTGMTGNQVLTTPMYQPLKLIATGAPAGDANLVVPAGVGGLWVVRNNTTGGFVISISSAAGGAVIQIQAGMNTMVTCDGSVTGMFLAINTPGAAAGLDTQVQFNSSGVLAGSADLTWSAGILSAKNLVVADNTQLGNAVGDSVTLGGTNLYALNGLAFNTSQFILGGPAFNQVAINTTVFGPHTLTVGGGINSTAGGFIFPDNTVQTTAAVGAPTGTIYSGYYGGVAPAGFILLNGSTIGDATSGALVAGAFTERLFKHLWAVTTQTWCPVLDPGSGSTGTRGASANADWLAHKRLLPPNHSGFTMAGRDNMSGAPANILTGFDLPAFKGGAQTVVLTVPNLPAHAHTITDQIHNHGWFTPGFSYYGNEGTLVGVLALGSDFNVFARANTDTRGAGITGTQNTGSATGHLNVQPTIAVDVIIAL